MSLAPTPAPRTSSLASLGVLVGGAFALCALWGLLVLAIFHPAGLDLGHPDRLPRAMQDSYTAGLYVAVAVATAWFWRAWERRPVSELAIAWNPLAWLFGWGLGALGIVMCYAVAMALGWARFIAPTPWPWGATAIALAGALVLSVLEEVFFRGIVLRTLLRDLRPATAIALSAALYAAAHFVHLIYQREDLFRVSGLFLTGLLFGYAAWSRKTIWLSAGLHGAWIFFIALSSQYNLWYYLPSAVRWTGGGYPPGGILMAISVVLCYLTLRRACS